jgi:SSS family solute:Na+ symporter
MPLIISSRTVVLERSDLFALPIIDLIVIALYFSLVIAIGIRSARRIQNQEDYFLAGRRFGKFIQTFAAFGQGTSADNAVGVTTTTFTNGIAGIWSSLLYLFATPLYWMVMPWMRRLRLLTLGDFFEKRYGSKPMAGVYAVIGSIGMMTIISVGFAAMTKTVVALTPKSIDVLTIAEQTEYEQAQELDHLKAQDFQSLTEQQKTRLRELTLLKPRKLFSHMNPDVLIWIVCGVVLIYAVAGGLEAAFLTDARGRLSDRCPAGHIYYHLICAVVSLCLGQDQYHLWGLECPGCPVHGPFAITGIIL